MADEHFIEPLYGSRCFSELPQLLRYLLLGGEKPQLPAELFERISPRYEAVVFFFVDAFGWRFFEKHRERYPFLQQLAGKGTACRLTSQFPSTTSAHVTCIHTGLPVGQSGVFEWFYYEPKLDAIIAPLLFSFAGTKRRNSLKSTGIDPGEILPTRTIYQELKEEGVRSHAFQPWAHLVSPYSTTTFQGAEVFPYTTLSEAVVNAGSLIEARQGPSYLFFYFDGIDAVGHQYGPDSLQIDAEIDTFLTLMDRLFLRRLRGKIKDALFIMTADHGLVETDPEKVVYLNLDERFAGLEKYLRRNRKGKLLVPAGSCRDMFLYIQDGMVEEARIFLAERLEGKAEVRQVQELIDRGYFGPPPLSPDFSTRAGDLVILPYKNESVWWYEKGKFEQKYYGHHGGLTPEEMEIPLLLWDFSE